MNPITKKAKLELDKRNVVDVYSEGNLDILLKKLTPNEMNEQLFVFSGEGNLEVVRWFVDHGADVNFKFSDGKTSLFMAAGKGHVSIVNYLLEKGAKVNAGDNYFSTSLISAYQYPEIIRILVKAGAKINHSNVTGSTIFVRVMTRHDYKTADFLIDNGAAIDFGKDETPLMEFCRRDNLKDVQYLVRRGANIHRKDKNGHSALSRALHGGKIWDFLVRKGASLIPIPNNKPGETRADIALMHSCFGELLYLLHNGMQLSDKHLHWIFSHGSLPVRNSITELLPLRTFKALVSATRECTTRDRNWNEESMAWCRIQIQCAVSLLIGREMCPASPFHRYNFPLDLLKIIFDMCEFLPLPAKVFFPWKFA
jgi:ankyrin repeat protein